MKRNIVILAIIFTIIPIYAVASDIPRQVLVKGKAVSVETGYDIGDVAVSDHSICDFMITEGRREIYLNPRKSGVITLTVWDADGRKREVVPVEVYDSDISDIVREAESLFADTNVEVDVNGRQVLLSGEATSKVVLEQAESFAARYPEVESDVRMSGDVLQTIAGRVEAAIDTPGVKVRNVRGRLVLEGVVYSGSQAQRVVEIARLYDPEILNLMEVKETGRRPGKDKLIKLDFYFMEIKKEALRSLGVAWAPGSMPKNSGSSGGGLMGGVSNFGSTIIGFVFNLLPKLKLLRERGEARTLENATFIVKSGEAAEFFNGTQVPYYSGDQVSFKDVGVRIHAEPIAAGDSVDLVVDATLSSLAANIEAGIDKRNISTSTYVRLGQSVVLANMISNRDVKTYNKKPTDVDTSSALFNIVASKDFQSGRSEFVLFIMPQVIDEADPAEERLREYLSAEEDMIGDRSRKEYMNYINEKGRMPKDKYMSGRRKRKGW